MMSWDLFDIYENAFSSAARLQPTQRSYGAFTDANSVRGGSTFYTV